MIIHLYSRCWNEEKMIPYYLRHYLPLVERIEVTDDQSNDQSVALLCQFEKVHTAVFTGSNESRVGAALQHDNHIWKTSRGVADWVILCDIDEHFYHPDLRGYLQHCQERGITAIRPQGFEMVADEFPQTDARLCDTVRRGAPSGYMEKIQVFNPVAIQETNYGPGRHQAGLQGQVIFPKTPEVKLLHYKSLGWPWLLERNTALGARVPAADRERGFSSHYHLPEKQKHREFKIAQALAVTVI